MHLDLNTHEHGASGRVFEYEADYRVDGDAIVWQATVNPVGMPPQRFEGTIELTSPGVATLAEEAVRDAIIKAIDKHDDGASVPRPGSTLPSSP